MRQLVFAMSFFVQMEGDGKGEGGFWGSGNCKHQVDWLDIGTVNNISMISIISIVGIICIFSIVSYCQYWLISFFLGWDETFLRSGSSAGFKTAEKAAAAAQEGQV